MYIDIHISIEVQQGAIAPHFSLTLNFFIIKLCWLASMTSYTKLTDCDYHIIIVTYNNSQMGCNSLQSKSREDKLFF